MEFQLDQRSGLPTYLQLVQQVRRALLLGLLYPGDQLPTVKEVVNRLVINPNTVLKAYRELEHLGLAEGRPGVGTFVIGSPATMLQDHRKLHNELLRWVARARAGGLDGEAISAMVQDALSRGMEASA